MRRAQQQQVQVEKCERLKQLCRKSRRVRTEEARGEREEPSGEEGGEGCSWLSDPSEGNTWTLEKMAPQLYVTMYKEQFASPGRVKREALRPTSAHRRNNPQPRPVRSTVCMGALKIYESVFSEREPFNHCVLANKTLQLCTFRRCPEVQQLSLITDTLYCPSSHTEVYNINVWLVVYISMCLVKAAPHLHASCAASPVLKGFFLATL